MSTQPAERDLRALLAANPRAITPAVALGELLIETGRPEEALAVTAKAVATPIANLNLWTVRGLALKALSRLDEAIHAYQRGVEVAPRSGIAEHNLAGALGDAQRFAESEAATRRAFAKGLDEPETWLVHARALQGQARFTEADAAYQQAICRRPDYFDAHGDLAQMRWMQSEDVNVACASLDAAIVAYPRAQMLRVKKAKLLEYANDLDGAIAVLAPILADPAADPEFLLNASQLLANRDPMAALALAERACAAFPNDPIAASKLCEANLAAGRADVAARIAQEIRVFPPLAQYATGLLATAWRLSNDARYRELYDYDRMVKCWRIDTPAPWTHLDAFLADLQISLEKLHPLRSHPLNQSLRHGTQTLQGLDKVDDPVIRAFFRAIDGPIRRHIGWLGNGNDPLGARAVGGYKFNGIWSARLRPNGYHTNHLHPLGWLSSACYISLPTAIERERQGWIKFGEPGIPTMPRLPPDYYVKPEPGLLVLFPSYLWHGTVPFTGDETRLTVAFDLLPD